MNNKTEFKTFNEDNFVERDGKLQEITVEITLEEYRNLLTERIYNEKEIEALQDKNKHLEDSLSIITEMICRNSEIKEKFASLFSSAAQLMKGDFTINPTESEEQQ
jgi:hypothetical protein